jgi:LuxR family transcriptional regulator, maltose regulon positive regulatory protein
MPAFELRLGYVNAALDRIEPAISSGTRPIRLVLDNLELLVNQDCLDALAEVAFRLPAGSQLALASRARPRLPEAVSRQLVEIGAAELAMDDGDGARTILQQAGDIVRLRPSLGVLPGQITELTAALEETGQGDLGASSLTTAELRLLPLLSTHLTLLEIGERLHLSRNTVKTQAISIYRKLGVSSRSQAMQRVRELGLLGT